MKEYRIQRFTDSVTIPVNNDTEDAAAITHDVNGIIRTIVVNAPAISGSGFTLTVLGNRGETLFSKASLVGNSLNVIRVDANNHPLMIPLAMLAGGVLTRIKSTGTTDANGSLTFDNGGAIADGGTVTIGSHVYRLKTALAQANDVLIEPDVAAVGTITSDNTNPDPTGTVAVDDQTYTFVASLTEAKATGTITATANGVPNDGDTITVDDQTYVFKTVFSAGPTVPNEVQIGADGEATLNNLRAAVNLSGTEGVQYSVGTLGASSATCPTAAAVAGDATLLVRANVLGTSGNSIVLTESATNITVTGTGTLSGGVNAVANEIFIGVDADTTLGNLKAAINGAAGEGTKYSTGTAQPTTPVTAGTIAAHALPITADTLGPSGNSIVLTESATHITVDGSGTLGGTTAGAWSGDSTLQNLVDAINLENGSGQSGTKYHAGTTANVDVTAAAVASHATVLTAVETIDDPTTVATTETAAHLAFGAATLVGGGELAARTFAIDYYIERG